MAIYAAPFDVTEKADHSPVTQADLAADAIIVPALAALTPDIPVISEERPLPAHAGGTFWLVDPLDGTREFIHRRDEFTVNIALIQNRKPVFGIVGVPATDLLYWGSPAGAFRQSQQGNIDGLRVRQRRAKDPVAVATSRSHASKGELDDLLADHQIGERIIIGSSLKFCLVAEGKADVYPRIGPTMEWDTAAGQALLERAGGTVSTLEGAPFLYAKPGLKNGGFIARGITI